MAQSSSISPTARNSVGRPSRADNDKVRSDLLDAARKHFLTSQFKAVSVRQIAETAGVNGAMVSYYFGNKQGLYLAMVEELLKSLEESLAEISQQHELTVADFSRSYSRILASNPWWPNFMVREVLFSEGETRNAMIERFATSFAPRLMASIQSEIGAGHYRSDLNPALTMLSLMAMTVFPFIARPLLESVLKIEINESTADTLANHNVNLFLHGVQNPLEEEGRTA